jgi:hypothetical protein
MDGLKVNAEGKLDGSPTITLKNGNACLQAKLPKSFSSGSLSLRYTYPQRCTICIMFVVFKDSYQKKISIFSFRILPIGWVPYSYHPVNIYPSFVCFWCTTQFVQNYVYAKIVRTVNHGIV